MAGLTHDEAVARAAGVTVHACLLQFDLPADGETFGAVSTLRFTAHAPETFLDVDPAELESVTLDGAELDTAALADRRFPLTGLGGEHEVVVRARMRYSHDGEGLHHFVDPADGAVYLCATSAVDNAKRWFACFDQPDLKTPYTVEVICHDDSWAVFGNGAAERVDGRWRLAPTPPLSTYHVTLVAGPWHSVRGEHDGIPLGVHARRSLGAELDRDAAGLLQLTADSFDAFHGLFGIRYPFGEYHQVFVPEFNWGAMENPGCVTFRDQLMFRTRPTDEQLISRSTTVVHEMAHMWFGDLVTMRWWDDLWLNESFAEHLSLRVTSAITDLPVLEDFAASRKAWGYAADRRRSTHPVAGNGAVDAASALEDFDGISYAKGASVLAQLATYLGDDVFLAGLRRHIAAHAYGNATFADLLGAWAAELSPGDATAARGLTEWADAWLRRAGVDIVAVDTDPGSPAVVVQRPLHGPAGDRPHAVSVAVVPDGPAVDVLLRDAPVPVDLTVPPGAVLLPNARDETWATVRLAPSAWELLPAVLPATTDGRARVALWNALRTGVEDGLVPPSLAVDTVVAGVATEVDVVVDPVLRWIAGAVPVFVAPGAARDRLDAAVTAAVRTLLDTAAPGSSLQLTAARAWAARADDLAALRTWTSGATVGAGLEVDVELQWTVLERRAALGDLDDATLDDALARDRTASGQVHATRCRALRPDAAAKEAAWALVARPSGVSQYEIAAAAEGLWVAGQEDLARDYASRWFDEIADTAAFRSGWSLARVADRAFPTLAVDADTVARAEALSARDDVPPMLRRVASDAGDDLRRALAVRESVPAA
ncbi:aminopeptidase N [Jatrophihabitans sp. YIM 134969]